MIYDEEDVKFKDIDDHKFEELCFDLLLRLGFHGLIWRQGGADSGRDIEAHFSVTNPLAGTYDEKWFFECKKYASGIPVDEVSSKFAWADAEEPKHLVILTTSYLTNSARTWIEKMAPKKPYRIHIIESKQLKSLIISFSDIIEKYFIDKYLKLLTEIKRNWIIMDLPPDFDTLYTLHEHVDLERLSSEYIALLWCFFRYDYSNRRAMEDEYSPFDTWGLASGALFERLVDISEEGPPAFEELMKIEKGRDGLWFYQSPVYYSEDEYTDHVILSFFINPDQPNNMKTGFYCFELLQDDAAVEVIVENNNSLDITARIRYVDSNAVQEIQVIRDNFTPPPDIFSG